MLRGYQGLHHSSFMTFNLVGFSVVACWRYGTDGTRASITCQLALHATYKRCSSTQEKASKRTVITQYIIREALTNISTLETLKAFSRLQLYVGSTSKA